MMRANERYMASETAESGMRPFFLAVCNMKEKGPENFATKGRI